MKGPLILLCATITWKFLCASADKDVKPLDPKGKWLDLSPWELNVLNDMMIEIALLKCPSLNKPAARSMKDFVTEAIKQAKFKEDMNPNFLPVYSNLVQCLDHLDEQSKNPGKIMRSAAAVIGAATGKKSTDLEKEIEGDKDGWISNAWEKRSTPSDSEDKSKISEDVFYVNVPEAYTTTEAGPAEIATTKKASNTEKVIADLKDYLAEIRSHFSGFMGQGDMPSPGSGLGSVMGLGAFMGPAGFNGPSGVMAQRKKRSSTYKFGDHNKLSLEEAAVAEALYKFQKMFLAVYQILTKSCPKELRPSGYFSGQVVKELLKWMSTQPYEFIQAAKKYLDKDMLLPQAQKCVSLLHEYN